VISFDDVTADTSACREHRNEESPDVDNRTHGQAGAQEIVEVAAIESLLSLASAAFPVLVLIGSLSMRSSPLLHPIQF